MAAATTPVIAVEGIRRAAAPLPLAAPVELLDPLDAFEPLLDLVLVDEVDELEELEELVPTMSVVAVSLYRSLGAKFMQRPMDSSCIRRSISKVTRRLPRPCCPP